MPDRIRNSPTNPFVPGSPTDESVTMTNTVAMSGTCLARPPYSEMSRVWRRSYSMPTRRKSAPVETPWFSIW